MRALEAQITGLGLWSSRCASVSDWRAGAQSPELLEPKPRILDRQCIRRASPFSRAMACAFEQAVEQAGVDLTQIATVFASALGETSVMLKLLDQIRLGLDEFSPMSFAVSVHNAASGLVSISTKNRAFTTSVAADYDTPAMALLEAASASLTFGVPAVVVCGEEAPPAALMSEDEAFETLAVAMVVESVPRAGARVLARFGSLGLSPADGMLAELPPALARNPQAGLLDLADAVLRGRWGRVRLDRGQGAGWSAELTPGT